MKEKYFGERCLNDVLDEIYNKIHSKESNGHNPSMIDPHENSKEFNKKRSSLSLTVMPCIGVHYKRTYFVKLENDDYIPDGIYSAYNED